MKKFKILLLLTLLFAGINNVKADKLALSTAFNNVINSYLDVKNALIASDADAAQAKAASILKALSAVSVKDMDAAQRKVWDSYLNKLNFDARHISETDPIDHKREHFATLSTNLITVLKAFNLNKATLYKQYCPMKKTYWLSETAAIKNPYYGNMMLTCGTTQATFEAGK